MAFHKGHLQKQTKNMPLSIIFPWICWADAL